MLIQVFAYLLTLDALEGSILSPYCKGFTWIHLNQKDLQREKINICFIAISKNLNFPKTATVLSLFWKRRGGREGTDWHITPVGPRLQKQAEI